MTRRLFEVTVSKETTGFVVAESREEAERLAVPAEGWDDHDFGWSRDVWAMERQPRFWNAVAELEPVLIDGEWTQWNQVRDQLTAGAWPTKGQG